MPTAVRSTGAEETCQRPSQALQQGQHNVLESVAAQPALFRRRHGMAGAVCRRRWCRRRSSRCGRHCSAGWHSMRTACHAGGAVWLAALTAQRPRGVEKAAHPRRAPRRRHAALPLLALGKQVHGTLHNVGQLALIWHCARVGCLRMCPTSRIHSHARAAGALLLPSMLRVRRGQLRDMPLQLLNLRSLLRDAARQAALHCASEPQKCLLLGVCGNRFNAPCFRVLFRPFTRSNSAVTMHKCRCKSSFNWWSSSCLRCSEYRRSFNTSTVLLSLCPAILHARLLRGTQREPTLTKVKCPYTWWQQVVSLF